MSTIPKDKFVCDFPKKKCKKQCITCYVKYVYATDGREELEKEIADLKLENQLSDDSIAEHKNTITALQSSLKEKEKECEELKEEVEWLTRKKQTIFELGMSWRKWAKEKLESQSKQIEELKAENERLEKEVEALKSNLYSKED